MGSGCNSSKYLSSCVDMTSSDCVKYVGDAVEALGICNGDTITEVVEVILARLQVVAEGKGIKLNDLVAGCADLDLLIQNSDKELASILKIILDRECSLQSQITTINTVINTTTPITVDLKCLPSTINTRAKLDQGLIDAICALTDRVATLEANIPQNTSITEVVTDILFDKLKSCNGGIEVSGIGVNRTFNFTGMIPVGGRIFGEFPLNLFDNSGKGSGIFCNFALANGLNGTRDMTGLVPAGAYVQGSTYTGTHNNVGIIKGTDTVTLESKHLADHTHTFSDPGHDHNVKTGPTAGATLASGTYVQNTFNSSSGTNSFLNTTDIQNSSTGIIVGGIQGQSGQAHNNLQPTLYGVWIQRIN